MAYLALCFIQACYDACTGLTFVFVLIRFRDNLNAVRRDMGMKKKSGWYIVASARFSFGIFWLSLR